MARGHWERCQSSVTYLELKCAFLSLQQILTHVLGLLRWCTFRNPKVLKFRVINLYWVCIIKIFFKIRVWDLELVFQESCYSNRLQLDQPAKFSSTYCSHTIEINWKKSTNIHVRDVWAMKNRGSFSLNTCDDCYVWFTRSDLFVGNSFLVVHVSWWVFSDLRSFHSEEISFLLSSVCMPKVEGSFIA